ncbi:MAG: HK97 gp10 family phage protein [Rhodospirillaceae bacterium]|nr:HK97 gp10 family phage protein [Rhodospirillaceae bacterium]
MKYVRVAEAYVLVTNNADGAEIRHQYIQQGGNPRYCNDLLIGHNCNGSCSIIGATDALSRQVTMPDVSIILKPNRAANRLLEQGGRRVKDAQRNLVKRATFDVQAESQRNAPVVTGALRRSAFAELRELRQLRARVRYQEPYARRVENLPRGGEGSRGRRGPRYGARAVATVRRKLRRFWQEEIRGLLR